LINTRNFGPDVMRLTNCICNYICREVEVNKENSLGLQQRDVWHVNVMYVYVSHAADSISGRLQSGEPKSIEKDPGLARMHRL
jgi:hypothetical protein